MMVKNLFKFIYYLEILLWNDAFEIIVKQGLEV